MESEQTGAAQEGMYAGNELGFRSRLAVLDDHIVAESSRRWANEASPGDRQCELPRDKLAHQLDRDGRAHETRSFAEEKKSRVSL